MTKIIIETETIETDLTPAEAAEKIREALGVWEFYWFTTDCGEDDFVRWCDYLGDRYRLAHGNCSPTQEGLAQHKADMAKLAAIVAIRRHRDKTFGVFEPDSTNARCYGHYDGEKWAHTRTLFTFGGITVPFATESDIQRSFVECAEHWEVLGK